MVRVRETEVQFRRYHERLAQFRYWAAGPQDWEDYWSEHSVEKLLETYSTGALGEYEILARYLPRDLPILEAGCGLARFVIALAARGYHVEGVDFSAQTIRRVQTAAPKLNVRVGDVCHLEAVDGTYGGYCSFGVLEHNPEGPLGGLREARRVLRPDGVAFISVPYLNPARQSRLRRRPAGGASRVPQSLSFYQYYFSRDEFCSLLNQAGFEMVEMLPTAVYWGWSYDSQPGRWLHRRHYLHWRLHRAVKAWCETAPMWARWRWGHMLGFVCRPTPQVGGPPCDGSWPHRDAGKKPEKTA